MTQADLAEAVGVDSRTIRNLETGEVAARIDTVADIAAAMGVVITDLLKEGGELKRNPSGRPRRRS